MTREEVLAEYDVNEHGIIQTPGKFEAEMLYVPAFWDATMDGSAGILDWSDGSSTYVVEIDDSDRATWPELDTGALMPVAIHMEETEQGFVNAEVLTQPEYEALLARNEADLPAEDNGEG